MSGWTMPAEGDEHERTWLAWPGGGYTLGDTAAEAEEARATWAAVANAVAQFEPVTVLVPASELAEATRRLSAEITVQEASLDDAWMRDIGPTFVRDASGAVAAVDWVFNGWGAQDWASWSRDAEIARTVAGLAGVPVIGSSLVNEGGGIHVDGAGTVLATRTVQLDPGRNPDWSAAQVEAEFARTLGAGSTIWLPRGLSRDSDTYGTRGHVDIVATLTRPGVALVHEQRDASHPDAAIGAEIVAALRSQPDASGDELEIVRLPAPTVLRDAEGFVDYSYVNHALVNGGVVACAFGDPNDDRAVGILAEMYPGRSVVAVDARALFARGGGIHCITQHQPVALRSPA
ncbi:agmatine deiminase family protein [Microbacteriaceae bacterium VKM Ac-2854]|nr:agmatine deiminase family protein [Microbacteriaceae bacterium VKM Ac-2854]